MSQALSEAYQHAKRFLQAFGLVAPTKPQAAVDLAQGILRRHNAWLRSVASGYEAKRRKVKAGQGRHRWISPKTGQVVCL